MGDGFLRTGHRWLLRISAAIVALTALLAPTAPMAHADEPVPLGGGSGLVVNGDTLCTLTAIGTDNRGNLIGFTSAHCGGPGAQVGAEGAEASGVLGEMVAGNDALDYAVIQFDPQRVRPVNNVDGFQIDGLGPDPIAGDIACKLGRTTGYSCGVTWGPGEEPGTIVNQVCGQPGDSGAPVTVNNRLVGYDPRRVHRRPADLHHQIHPAAHAGGHHVDQRGARGHHRKEPAGIRLRSGRRVTAAGYFSARIASNTVGSTNVDVSPSSRPSATSRSSRRMILPLRVLGSSGTT